MLLALTIIHLTKVCYKGINKIVDNLFSSLCFVSPDVLEPYVTPTVVKDSILATGLMKVYHHGFDN